VGECVNAITARTIREFPFTEARKKDLWRLKESVRREREPRALKGEKEKKGGLWTFKGLGVDGISGEVGILLL